MKFADSYGKWRLIGEGKVRRVYRCEADDNDCYGDIALVATDGVSAFDQRLGVEIKDKGKILTALSAFWSTYLEEKAWLGWLSGSAFLATDLTSYDEKFVLHEDLKHEDLRGRVTQMVGLKMLPVELIVRGYITGSLWQAYENGVREFCGVLLPEGLRNGDKLPLGPIFTPTTKAPEGEHDQNLTSEDMANLFYQDEELVDALVDDPNDPAEMMAVVRQIESDCLTMYERAAEYAESHGLIIADTKFEVGVSLSVSGKAEEHEIASYYFADEVLTPDSSRYWLKEPYDKGREMISLDKQIIRDYVADAKRRGADLSVLPQTVLDATREQYLKCYEMLTEHKLSL